MCKNIHLCFVHGLDCFERIRRSERCHLASCRKTDLHQCLDCFSLVGKCYFEMWHMQQQEIWPTYCVYHVTPQSQHTQKDIILELY